MVATAQFVYALVFVGSACSQSLLLVEFGKNSKGEQTQELVRYDFQDGHLTSRSAVASTIQVRFDLGDNWLKDNRYLLNSWGDTLDMSTGAVTHIKRRNEDEEEGEWSPDHRKLASGVMASGRLVLKKPKRDLGDGYWVDLLLEANTFPEAPVFWLDNYTLLSQRHNGNIVKVHLNGAFEDVVKIPGLEATGSLPYFYRNSEGQLIYHCNGEYIIDVGRRTYEPYYEHSLGNGFSLDVHNEVIRYQGDSIGSFHTSEYPHASAKGVVALIYGSDGSNLGYPDGVRVWSAASREWTTIKVGFLATIIGWIPSETATAKLR